jgi:hypothetical protein
MIPKEGNALISSLELSHKSKSRVLHHALTAGHFFLHGRK